MELKRGSAIPRRSFPEKKLPREEASPSEVWGSGGLALGDFFRCILRLVLIKKKLKFLN